MDRVLLRKVREAKTPEELLGVVNSAGLDITADEAQVYFVKFNIIGELSDEEFDAISGVKSLDTMMKRQGIAEDES